jgi:hypothetical protein
VVIDNDDTIEPTKSLKSATDRNDRPDRGFLVTSRDTRHERRFTLELQKIWHDIHRLLAITYEPAAHEKVRRRLGRHLISRPPAPVSSDGNRKCVTSFDFDDLSVENGQVQPRDTAAIWSRQPRRASSFPPVNGRIELSPVPFA